MKLTTKQIRQIIVEELRNVMEVLAEKDPFLDLHPDVAGVAPPNPDDPQYEESLRQAFELSDAIEPLSYSAEEFIIRRKIYDLEKEYRDMFKQKMDRKLADESTASLVYPMSKNRNDRYELKKQLGELK